MTFPKIIFQTTGKITGQENIWKTLHPEWKYVLFDNDMCIDFLFKHFPPNYVEAFDSIIAGAFKADLIRLCWLYINGGFYIDMDMEPVTKDVNFFENMVARIENEHGALDMILCRELSKKGVYNALMVTKPRSELIKEMIDLTFNNVLKKRHPSGYSQLSITGPRAIVKVILKEYCLRKCPTGLVKRVSKETVYFLQEKRVRFGFYSIYYKNKELIKRSRDKVGATHYSKLSTRGLVYDNQTSLFSKRDAVFYSATALANGLYFHKYRNCNLILLSLMLLSQKKVTVPLRFQHIRLGVSKTKYQLTREYKSLLLARLVPVLQEFGVEYTVGHGNLIEIYRKDSPIMHDDDIDIRYNNESFHKWWAFCQTVKQGEDGNYVHKGLVFDRRLGNAKEQKHNGVQVSLHEPFKDLPLLRCWPELKNIHCDIVPAVCNPQCSVWVDYDKVFEDECRQITYLGVDNVSIPSVEMVRYILRKEYGKSFHTPNILAKKLVSSFVHKVPLYKIWKHL
jgi:hypothetical protein